jgi:hypothetical protein
VLISRTQQQADPHICLSLHVVSGAESGGITRARSRTAFDIPDAFLRKWGTDMPSPIKGLVYLCFPFQPVVQKRLSFHEISSFHAVLISSRTDVYSAAACIGYCVPERKLRNCGAVFWWQINVPRAVSPFEAMGQEKVLAKFRGRLKSREGPRESACGCMARRTRASVPRWAVTEPPTPPDTKRRSRPKGCVDFAVGPRYSLGRDRCGYRRRARALAKNKIASNAAPAYFSDALLATIPSLALIVVALVANDGLGERWNWISALVCLVCP